MKPSRAALSLAFLAMTVSQSFAGSAGTSGAEILKIGVGARAIAMGEAYTALADDVSSLYWNPAGLAYVNRSEASFMYSQWLQDLSYHHLAVATPLENGGIGASLSYLSFGQIEGIDEHKNPTGNVNAYSGTASLGGAWLGDFWSLGATVKGVQTALADVRATGIAADLGANAYYPHEVLGGTLRAAASYRNLGTGMRFLEQRDPFPSEWRMGVAAVELMRRHLNLSADFGKARDESSAFYGGAEFWLGHTLALRAGYSGRQAEGSGLRAGAGVRLKDFSFDYAYTHYGDLGLTHRYELSCRFGALRPELTPEQRRMLKRARLAIREERYAEATLILNGLIDTQPNYKTFHRLVKRAMSGLEAQERLARRPDPRRYQPPVTGSRYVDNNPGEQKELEDLLRLSEAELSTAGTAKQGGAGR